MSVAGSEIEIVFAAPDDAEAVALLTGGLLGEIMEKVGEKVFRFDEEATRERAADLIGRGVYFVLLAREGGGCVGYLSMFESYALYTEGAYGTIPEFYVVPECRSRGIGRQLLEAARAFASAKGWKRFEVTTPPLPEFDRTLAFYKVNGFAISGGRKLKSEL
jgi:GNAT superfamily N-acetyltransferase